MMDVYYYYCGYYRKCGPSATSWLIDWDPLIATWWRQSLLNDIIPWPSYLSTKEIIWVTRALVLRLTPTFHHRRYLSLIFLLLQITNGLYIIIKLLLLTGVVMVLELHSLSRVKTRNSLIISVGPWRHTWLSQLLGIGKYWDKRHVCITF